jgi:uncharacterized protein
MAAGLVMALVAVLAWGVFAAAPLSPEQTPPSRVAQQSSPPSSGCATTQDTQLGHLCATLASVVVTLDVPGQGSVELHALVADTAEARSVGLSRVAELPRGLGMLFLFDGVGDHGGFWMRNTLVPLDLVFLGPARPDWELAAGGPDAVVLSQVSMVPCLADPCPVFSAPGPYLAALEVMAETFPALPAGTPVWFSTRPEG